jgi:hypothetical protein
MRFCHQPISGGRLVAENESSTTIVRLGESGGGRRRHYFLPGGALMAQWRKALANPACARDVAGRSLCPQENSVSNGYRICVSRIRCVLSMVCRACCVRVASL